MHLAHSKRGWIVPVIVIAAIYLGGVLQRALHVPRDQKYRDWPISIALLIAGSLMVYVGERLKRRDGRLVYDARRSRLVHLPAGHTFFWIDVRVWGWIVTGSSVATLFRAS